MPLSSVVSAFRAALCANRSGVANNPKQADRKSTALFLDHNRKAFRYARLAMRGGCFEPGVVRRPGFTESTSRASLSRQNNYQPKKNGRLLQREIDQRVKEYEHDSTSPRSLKHVMQSACRDEDHEEGKR